MTGRSLQASSERIEKARRALNRKNMTQTALVKERGIASWSTVNKFFNGKPVDRRIFIEICEELELDWHEIAAKPTSKHEPATVEDTASNNTDFVGREEAIAESTPDNELDELVRTVREKRYNKIQDQCRTLRILDVEQEIEIDDLYIDVNVLEEIPSYKHKKFPELLEGLNPEEINRIGFGRHQERLPGLKAVEKYRKLMILGQPGSGKTTFLQHIAIECNQSSFQAKCVPIFIRLREFTENAKDVGDFSLFNYISYEFSCCHIAEPEQTITKLLHDGRALILLDGLDEVPEQDREELLKQIRKFVRDYFSNQLIITCRIAEGQSRFKNFTNVEIADFTPEQIEKFAKKWFVSLAQKSNRDEEEGFHKATKLMEKLDENERILELAVTPLLLTFICLVFQHGDELLAKRSELYEKGMNILLNKWDRDRGIKRDEVYHNLSPYHKIKLLSHVASATFEKSPYYLFEQRTVQGYIADYLGALPDAAPDSEQLFHDSEAVLQAIGAQHGLLTAQAQGIYSFSHRTFQEYFMATEIVLSSNPQALGNWVSHITEKRWHEVFLLVSEMFHLSRIPDKLLCLMKQQIDIFLASEEKLQEFLRWVSQKSSSAQVPYKPAALRAFYLANELASAVDLNWEMSFAKLLNNIDFYPDRELHISRRLAYALDRTLFRDISCSLKEALDRPSTFGIIFDRDITFALACERDFSFYFEFKQNLSAAGSELATVENQVNHGLTIGLTCRLVLVLDCAEFLARLLRLTPELKQLLQQLKKQIPEPDEDTRRFQEWWKIEGQDKIKQLRALVNDHRNRNIGQDWQFSSLQKELLEQYYDVNKLLVDCLNSGCKVSPEVRSHIEDTLLLPIAEIEKRKLGH